MLPHSQRKSLMTADGDRFNDGTVSQRPERVSTEGTRSVVKVHLAVFQLPRAKLEIKESKILVAL